MAWDTEGTRRRIRESATAEFAAFGPDGTTMARIAERAGVNKERLYNYFGDKRALFRAVLSDELTHLSETVVLPAGDDFELIGEFAGRTYDYYSEHPELARLLLWEGLADGTIVDEADRTDHYRQKVAAYSEAQRAGIVGSAIDADHLVLLVIGLAAWWFCVPQLARMVTGFAPGDQVEQQRRRSAVVTAAQQMAEVRGDGDPLRGPSRTSAARVSRTSDDE
ncbi:TetR/AcrR family transcriptional regulator [Brevibacterium atlanticum]|uniref:TetR/AcrR family transcriptional regulator n=1 Tax=Brevibacterium atlanticum TaxID=2697563 RepID=UPI00142117E0|nr:TetR family transcriptional regulator [Brevibacterium atlanticum]